MAHKFLVIFLLFNWFTSLFETTPTINSLMHEKIMMHVAKEKKEHNLSCIGIGGGFTDSKIRDFSICYEFSEYSDLLEARKLLVTIIEDLIKIVEKDPKIEEYLLKTPVSSEAANISIRFPRKKLSDDPQNPFIHYAFIVNNKIYYSILSPSGERLDDFFEETYEEALKIVREEEARHCLENNNAS